MKASLRNTHGQGMVEFALVIPLLLLLLMGIFDLGQGVYAYNVVASAAREGARFGILDPTNTTGIQNQARANTVGLAPSRINVPTPQCADSDGSGNPININNTCNADRAFILVTVTYTFQPITLFVPGVTVTGKSLMAIEP